MRNNNLPPGGGSGSEKRRGGRIGQHYILWTRQIAPSPDSDDWDASTVRNISKTGILFHSSQYYDPGSELEIKISNPIVAAGVKCWGRVVRCVPSQRMKTVYEVAVNFTKIDEIHRADFEKTIEEIIRKKREI